MRINDLNEAIHKMNPEDPMDPEVAVSGYGVLTLKSLERMVARDLADLAKRAASGDWDNVTYLISNSPLQAKIDAINTAYEQLEQIRRKGGKNARGIEKR